MRSISASDPSVSGLASNRACTLAHTKPWWRPTFFKPDFQRGQQLGCLVLRQFGHLDFLPPRFASATAFRRPAAGASAFIAIRARASNTASCSFLMMGLISPAEIAGMTAHRSRT